MMNWQWRMCVAGAAVACVSAVASADDFAVTFSEDAAAEPQAGRVILFFAPDEPRWRRIQPASGPFWHSPQPIASIPVDGLEPGETVRFSDAGAGELAAFPGPPHELEGPWRVQAVLDRADRVDRSHRAPGNWHSDVESVDLTPGRDGTVTLTIDQEIEEPTADDSRHDNLEYVEIRSELLSEFYGRDVHLRAGVALPRGYDDEDSDRTHWPVLYRIPSFGDTHTRAERWAQILATTMEEVTPQTVIVVLDPESPLGHHGFVDNANHGPRGRALVEELIPHLEEEYRLVDEPTGRILTGHSSGGWSALWLQMQWPDVFGACWASSPDPVDFSAFQKSDIYEDESMFTDAGGELRPAFRQPTRQGGFEVAMTVEQEVGMERAIHPLGGSGQQWDTWRAMFSPPDDETGFPNLMFDSTTGAIDRDVAEHWKAFDIARLVDEDWSTYGPIITQRVRLACGRWDEYYLHHAVENLKEVVESHHGESVARSGGPHDAHDANDHDWGYIWLLDHATHSNIHNFITPRWNEEMRRYLREHGHHD